MPSDASQLYQLVADLGKAASKAAPLARLVVQKTCADTKADAQVLAPVDTGALRNSISYRTFQLRDGARGEVGPTVNYGLYVEVGTSRMGPQPYLGPAFERRSAAFVQAIAQIADRAL